MKIELNLSLEDMHELLSNKEEFVEKLKRMLVEYVENYKLLGKI